MPKYSYECFKCGIFDTLHTIDKPLKECPTCKSKVIKRVFLMPPSAIVKNPLPTREGRGKG